jgi:hypothetical protein
VVASERWATSKVKTGSLAVRKEAKMLGIILLVVLVIALFGVMPTWRHSREWGYFPSGGVGLVLLVVVILLLLGRL